MFEHIINIDTSMFEFLNGTLHNPFFDNFFTIITHKQTWIPLYIILAVSLMVKFRAKSIVPLVCIVFAVGASDYVCSGYLKPTTKRLRPCANNEVKSRVVTSCNSTYGFCSSHASTHMAIAVFMLLLLGAKGWRKMWFLWAFLIGYSRIYVGVHYPLDVFFGFLIGGVFGILFYKLNNKILTKFPIN